MLCSLVQHTALQNRVYPAKQIENLKFCIWQSSVVVSYVGRWRVTEMTCLFVIIYSIHHHQNRVRTGLCRSVEFHRRLSGFQAKSIHIQFPFPDLLVHNISECVFLSMWSMLNKERFCSDSISMSSCTNYSCYVPNNFCDKDYPCGNICNWRGW